MRVEDWASPRSIATRRCYPGDSLQNGDAAYSEAPGMAWGPTNMATAMTCKISRSMFAMAAALGMLAALSSPSRAALSTTQRNDAAVVVAQAPEPVTEPDQQRKSSAPKTKPPRLTVRPRFGYPCH